MKRKLYRIMLYTPDVHLIYVYKHFRCTDFDGTIAIFDRKLNKWIRKGCTNPKAILPKYIKKEVEKLYNKELKWKQ